MSHTESSIRDQDHFARFHRRMEMGVDMGLDLASTVVNRIAGQTEPVRLALITQKDAGLQTIRRHLYDPARYIVREVLSAQDTREQLTDFRFEILVMRVPFFSATHVQMAARVYAAFPHAGLIASCLEIDPMARFQARNIPSMKILTEPDELQDLGKVIDKLKRKETSGLRQHVRNRREGEAEIVDSRGVRLNAQFVNFAQMGARLTVRSKELLHKGDRVQLQYRSSINPQKIHRIEAQVTWQLVSGKMVDAIVSGPMQTIGIRFLGML